MLKHSKDPVTTISTHDASIIKRALDCMTSEARKINEEKKKAEHVERVGELQSMLHKWTSHIEQVYGSPDIL
jgi:hypothetical protein